MSGNAYSGNEFSILGGMLALACFVRSDLGRRRSPRVLLMLVDTAIRKYQSHGFSVSLKSIWIYVIWL